MTLLLLYNAEVRYALQLRHLSSKIQSGYVTRKSRIEDLFYPVLLRYYLVFRICSMQLPVFHQFAETVQFIPLQTNNIILIILVNLIKLIRFIIYIVYRSSCSWKSSEILLTFFSDPMLCYWNLCLYDIKHQNNQTIS